MWGFESSIPSHECTARSSSGPGRRPLKAEIAGSNPARATRGMAPEKGIHVPSLGPPELLLILVLALILFGAGKLSDVGGALGKSIREFRRSASDEEPKAEQPKPPDEPPGPKVSV